MTLRTAASLAALMLALTACSSLAPKAPVPERASLAAAETANRFETVMLGEADPGRAVYADPALDALRAPSLSKFRSEAEFFSWLKLVRTAADARMQRRWRDFPTSAAPAEAAADAVPAPPPPPPPPAMAAAPESAQDQMTVPVSKIEGEAENPEITNNQKAGVDEGGIIKQVGNHLIVLQDGRLFVTDLKPGGAAGLKLTDRANVYRSDMEDTWYDEMLVSGRTILVTGYSYAENASEFTVLTLSDDGKVTREATFYISSDDYYSGSNYATRMIDGKLVIHTPIYISGRGWWDRFDPPEIREWRREGEEGERQHLRGRPLFRAEDIWMPVQRLIEPVIHTVTVCDISGATDTSAPVCEATAIVGSTFHEFLVTKDAFWLWLSPSWSESQQAAQENDYSRCDTLAETGSHARPSEVAPAVLVRLPIDGSTPGVLGVKGMPKNQFGMDMDAGTFRAALDWHADVCGMGAYSATAVLTYFETPLSALSSELADEPGGRYTPLPSPGTSDYEVRFTERHLVYGARQGWGTWAPDEAEAPRADGRAIIVPVDDPAWPTIVSVPHDVIRAERAGPYMALTGYRDAKGLSLSLIDLRSDIPTVADTLVLDNRFESENRSHAFNSRIGADGAGLIGLPTVTRSEESDRWWWWSASSDLSYIETKADGALSKAGDLIATRRDPDLGPPNGYACEVSCVDWYGNARPVFTGGRLLALVNSELIEGVFEDGQVREIRRIDLTDPLPGETRDNAGE